MSAKYAFVMWDWKQQIDPTELNTALEQVFDGTHCPITMAVDTGGDDYALLVSSEPIDSETAQDLFLKWYESL